METENQQLQTRDQLSRAFVAGAKRFFETYPHIKHTWSINEGSDYYLLEIPAVTEDGFEIACVLEERQLVVSYGGHHDHFELEGSVEEFVNHLLGFIYDLLSPAMRIKEYRAGSSSYKWVLQMKEELSWETESTSALIFYNYFGRKSERIYQNNQLPVR